MFARKPLAMLSVDTSLHATLEGYQPYFNHVKNSQKTDQPKGQVEHSNPKLSKFNKEAEELHYLEISYDFRAAKSVLTYFDRIDHFSDSGKVKALTLVALLKYLTITHKEPNRKTVIANNKLLHNNVVKFPKVATNPSKNLTLNVKKSNFIAPSLVLSNYRQSKTIDCRKVTLYTLKKAFFKHSSRSAYIGNLYEYLYVNAKPLPLGPKLRAIIWQIQGGFLPNSDCFIKTGLLKQILDVTSSDLAIKHFQRLTKLLVQNNVSAESNSAKLILMEARRLAKLNIPCNFS